MSDPAALGFDPERLARIPTFLEQHYLAPGLLPHAAVLVGRGDEIAHLSFQGQARAGQPLREDAIFRIASMSKPITSIAFLQLVEEGKVELADPVTTVVPEWRSLGVFVSGGDTLPFATRPPRTIMRMVDLLRHTAGFTYGFQERTSVDAAYRAQGLERFDRVDLEGLIAALAALPLEFDPGTAWNYSVATDVLGAIIQRIEDKPLDQVLAERIFGPLDMVDTSFQVPADKLARMPDCYALHPDTGTQIFDAGATSAWAQPPKLLSGGGGLASTLADYHRFCRMLRGGGALEGARIIGRKSLALMAANHLPGGGDLTQHSISLFSESENAGTGFGLGFATTIDRAATMALGSEGDLFWDGVFSTSFLVDPVEDLIFLFMSQLMPANAYPVRRQLRAMMYAALR
nr:serine hydrolase domain-containing protein [Haliangium ochraceum]